MSAGTVNTKQVNNEVYREEYYIIEESIKDADDWNVASIKTYDSLEWARKEVKKIKAYTKKYSKGHLWEFRIVKRLTVSEVVE